ncbi:MAG TPA: type II secretion system protein [Burkholderiales bacterium]|nr:type II secretion system protein [Burkholderiales bacterium]
MTGRWKWQTMSGPNRGAIRGFTLTEAIMVIVITGILASMVAVFIQKPVQGFFDTTRRAALVDAADTILRRLSRDVREALPNSVRVSAGTALEFLHVRSAGRYREQGPGDVLDFGTNDTSFAVLGPTVNVQSGDSIVVYNLGVAGANAYQGTNISLAVAPFGASLINVAIAGFAFPFSSSAKRFQVVDTPVSYICSGTQMRRYSGYAIVSAQPVPPGGTGSLIASQLSGCSFAYATGASEREALVTVSLALTDTGETVSLIYQIHVNNAP